MRTGGCVTWLAEIVSGHVPPRVRVPRERRKKWGVAAVIPPSLPPSLHPSIRGPAMTRQRLGIVPRSDKDG